MLKLWAGLALVAGTLAGQQNLIDQGFSHFYNLEYDEAIAVFDKAIAQNPSNPDLHNHMAQTLIFREMFRDGALESELVSGNNSFLRRANELGLTAVVQGAEDKRAAFEQMLREQGIEAGQVCSVGDDLPDVPLLRRSGLAVAVADACAEAKEGAHYVTAAAGRCGAGVESRDQIGDLGIGCERLEAVCETDGNIELAAVLGRQIVAFPAQIGGRIGPQIDQHIMDSTLRAVKKLDLLMGRALEMHAPH